MKLRDEIWTFIGSGAKTRTELTERFHDRRETLRRTLHRMLNDGEVVRTPEGYAQGSRLTAGKAWREDEEHVIRRFRHEGWVALARRLPGRTRTAIRSKAEHMKLLEKPIPDARLPVFTRGHLSPLVRPYIAEVA